VVNPNTLEILGVIQTGKSTENMVMIGTRVFAANWSAYNQTGSNNTIQVIDVAFDALVDSIQVVKEPNSMVVDKNNKLWVLCSGGYLNEEIPALHCINPDNLEIIRTMYFESNELSPEHLTINGTGDTLYYINQSVYRLGINDTQLPDQAFVHKGNHNFFTLGVDPEKSQVVVTDAGNFVQNGNVFRYSPDGILIDSAQVGIIPGFIGYN
jgi:DNA-binding beta-propeller fold protein YncE